MKYRIEVKLPEPGDMTNEINKIAKLISQGVKVKWGERGEIKGFTIPLNPDKTAATQLGYLNMLVEAPVTQYAKDVINCHNRAAILRGWPKIERP